MADLQEEINKRRTFGIVSHPDAGKTTLTEKLLLFGGAIQEAGAVKSNKIKKGATSDFMEIERQRGISVATSVMAFDYRDRKINILDTPGHKDFAEDTFRTLTAVDSVIVVIDVAKGVEAQTERLVEVCRMRKTPIIVFINKMDREGKDGIDLLDEIEEKLGLNVTPLSWPAGMGQRFKGVYNIYKEELLLFSPHGKQVQDDILKISDLSDPILDEKLGSALATELREETEMMTGVYPDFNREDYLNGEVSPVFFGSAINNFGVREILNTLVELAPSPGSRKALQREVSPAENKFSAVVFKIQANMDPSHHDRIAFLRVTSGRFEKGKKLRHVRIKRDVVINNASSFMAAKRDQADSAYAGDILGFHNHGTIQIGDTFTEGEELKFTGIPNFAPELFRRVQLKDPLRAKALQKGLIQLSEEGATQVFRPMINNDLILGAVGVLQFDVVAHRLKNEYNVESLFEPVQVATARWLRFPDAKTEQDFLRKNEANVALDGAEHITYIAPNMVNLQLTMDRWPKVEFMKTREI